MKSVVNYLILMFSFYCSTIFSNDSTLRFVYSDNFESWDKTKKFDTSKLTLDLDYMSLTCSE